MGIVLDAKGARSRDKSHIRDGGWNGQYDANDEAISGNEKTISRNDTVFQAWRFL